MAIELVYKTQDPDIVAWLQKHYDEARKLHRRRLGLARRITKKIGPGKKGTRVLFTLETWHGESFITGIEATPEDMIEAPRGWRYDRSHKQLVPAKRSAEGRLVQEELNLYAQGQWLRKLADYGVPLEFRGSQNEYGSSTLYFPGLRLDDEKTTAYLTWGTGHVRTLMRKSSFFEEVALEDYLASLEKKEKADA